MELLDPDWHSRFQNPFDIICGTSAGAINAAALACRADRPHLGVRRVRRLWSSLSTDMIYRADAPGLIRTGVRWLGLLSLGWMYSGLTRKRPQSLLDNSPCKRCWVARLRQPAVQPGRARSRRWPSRHPAIPAANT